MTKRRNVEKIAIRCRLGTIKIAAQAMKSMPSETKFPRRHKCLSSETLNIEIMLAVLEEKEFVPQEESELIAPPARFRFSKL